MKVRSAIKTMCKDCYIVRRGKNRYVCKLKSVNYMSTLFVIIFVIDCKTSPKHKQRQGFHTLIDSVVDPIHSNIFATISTRFPLFQNVFQTSSNNVLKMNILEPAVRLETKFTAWRFKFFSSF